MPRIITYSLRRGAQNSDDYYRVIARFADEWSARAARATKDVTTSFRLFRQEGGLPDRSEAEYAFELLALGVLLREHGTEAARSPEWWTRAQSRLVKAQERWPLRLRSGQAQFEGVVKQVRGWLGWIGRRIRTRRADGDDVSRLIAWLNANGEDAKADRLSQWQDFFEGLGPSPARNIVARSLALADGFAAESARALGPYTVGVERFLSETAPKYHHRYDAEFVSRTRLEYHLGLLGTEVLSRAYRERFRRAKRKIVIVPPCMRAQPEEKCKAIATPLGAQCQHCTPACRVHQITKLGEKRGFEVTMIPDELRVFGAGVGGASLGVVGVSCALTNWSGGWEADAMGVPAQGLLLDYVGCKFHWDEKGIPTDTNLKKLEDMLGKEEQHEQKTTVIPV
jgi:uncharacterized protein